MNELEARVRVLELAQKHAPNHEDPADTCIRAAEYWLRFIVEAVPPVQQPPKKVVAPKP